jgi:hypothetical protein
MPRKSTDLLDVFGAGRGSGGGRTPPSKPPAAPREPKSRRPFEGVFLGPRQVVLASSIGVLLLVLSFTVGIGVGKSGGKRPDGAPALKRESTAWILRGELSRIDAARGEDVTEARILQELERRFGVPRTMVRIDVTTEPATIVIGPFPTEADARAFLDSKRLVLARLGSGAPFRYSKPLMVRGR